MPSSMITVDETGQVYWANESIIHRSVDGSGGIFRETYTSAFTVPDSLSVVPPLLFSVTAFQI